MNLKNLNGFMKKAMAKSQRDLDIRKKKEAEIRKAEALKNKDLPPGQLSDKQIENWRKVLFLSLGPYALIMPKNEIQKIHDKMQSDINALDVESQEEGHHES